MAEISPEARKLTNALAVAIYDSLGTHGTPKFHEADAKCHAADEALREYIAGLEQRVDERGVMLSKALGERDEAQGGYESMREAYNRLAEAIVEATDGRGIGAMGCLEKLIEERDNLRAMVEKLKAPAEIYANIWGKRIDWPNELRGVQEKHAAEIRQLQEHLLQCSQDMLEWHRASKRHNRILDMHGAVIQAAWGLATDDEWYRLVTQLDNAPARISRRAIGRLYTALEELRKVQNEVQDG